MMVGRSIASCSRRWRLRATGPSCSRSRASPGAARAQIPHATVLDRCDLRCAAARSWPRRADGRGPHRAGPRHLRRRSVQGGASRSTASRRHPLAGGRHPRTASAWFPRTASSRPCSSLSRCAATSRWPRSRTSCLGRLRHERAERAGRATSEARSTSAWPRPTSWAQSLGRQPAEGGAGALAGARAEGADRRRADPRHRRRAPRRKSTSCSRHGARRHRDHRHLLRTARDAGDQRPHRDHARGAGHRRDPPRARPPRNG